MFIEFHRIKICVAKSSCKETPTFWDILASRTRERCDSFQHKYDKSENNIKLGDNAFIYVLCENIRERILVSCFNQSKEIREKRYALYFKPETLKLSKDVTSGCCFLCTCYLRENCAVAYSQLLNMFVIFNWGGRA